MGHQRAQQINGVFKKKEKKEITFNSAQSSMWVHSASSQSSAVLPVGGVVSPRSSTTTDLCHGDETQETLYVYIPLCT